MRRAAEANEEAAQATRECEKQRGTSTAQLAEPFANGETDNAEQTEYCNERALKSDSSKNRHQLTKSALTLRALGAARVEIAR